MLNLMQPTNLLKISYAEILKKLRKDSSEKLYSFGIKYLDVAACGIQKNDLIIISSYSGKGKTQLATSIAVNNANKGVRVKYYSLESFKYEIDFRIAYANASLEYLENYGFKPFTTYSEYIVNKIDLEFIPYIENAEKNIDNIRKNLNIFYRDNSQFSINDFSEDLSKCDITTDLIIIDHLHFFDYDERNEYSEISKIIKKIRDLSQITGIPIILISHLNKPHFTNKKIIPGLDDLHGSSNIGKVASKVIFISHEKKTAETPYLTPTLFRVAKNRNDGSVCNYVGLQIFDNDLQKYDENYSLGFLNFYETEYEDVKNKPRWAK